VPCALTMAHSASANTWDLLKNDPDRYIYEPVRRGTDADEAEWEKSLPKNIAMGLEEKEGGTGILPVSSSSSKESRRDVYSPFLEPLYERLLERLRALLAAFRIFKTTSANPPPSFERQKKRSKASSNPCAPNSTASSPGNTTRKNLKTDATLKNWQASHEPFHWFVEFYGIMNSGGFDVIV
jgi:hypothetical protein